MAIIKLKYHIVKLRYNPQTFNKTSYCGFFVLLIRSVRLFFCTTTGVNQLQWALEFLRCMKVDYGYPETIEKIVNELEEKLITLYAKVGEKIQEKKRKKDLEQLEKDENEVKTSKS